MASTFNSALENNADVKTDRQAGDKLPLGFPLWGTVLEQEQLVNRSIVCPVI